MIRLLLVVLVIGCGLHAAEQEQSGRLYFQNPRDTADHEYNLRYVFDEFMKGNDVGDSESEIESEIERDTDLVLAAFGAGATCAGAGIDINSQAVRSLPNGNKYLQTLLSFMAYRGDYKMVCLLLERGACPNAVEGQFSALERSFGVDRIDIVTALLDAGAQEYYTAGSVKGSLLDRSCQCFSLCSSELVREFICQSYVPQWRTMIVALHNRGLPYGDKYQDVIDRVLAEHEDAQAEAEALSDDT